MSHYDVIVIGAGPAGGGVATPLVKAGKKIAMVEANGVGGVCPLRGCNPKKVLLAGAEAVEKARNMQDKGIVGVPVVDWSALNAFKRSFVAPVSERAEKHYRELGIDLIHGRATFSSPNSIEINGRELTADTICICTGYVPNMPDISGIENTITSNDFLHLETLPNSIVFIGGGFIAFEFAHIAARAGAKVTVLVRSNRALRGFNARLVDKLIEASIDSGLDIRLNSPVEAIEEDEEGLSVITEDITFETDMVVNCAGRIAALEGLNVEKAGLKAEKRGILVDERMRCIDAQHIYAIGDVASTPFALTPTASHEADVAAQNILKPDSAKVNFQGVPSVAFTIPPIASVGLSEEQAQKDGIPHKVIENEMSDWFPWKRLGEKHGACRILVDNDKTRILGAHIFGHHAEELANIFALIIRHRIPLSQVRDTLWAYPTSGYYLKFMN